MIRFGVHSHQAPAPFQLPFRTWDCNGAQSIADLSIVKSAVARYGDVLHTLGPATPTPEYITALVQAGVSSIELWNEPDHLWPGIPGDLMAQSRMVYQAAKAANPQVTIVAPGTQSSTWFEQFSMSMDPALWFDVIGVHVYAPDLMGWWNTAYALCAALRDVNSGSTRLRGMPIWITEAGIPWRDWSEWQWCQFFEVGEALGRQVPTLERVYLYAYDQTPSDAATGQFNYQGDAAFQAISSRARLAKQLP